MRLAAAGGLACVAGLALVALAPESGGEPDLSPASTRAVSISVGSPGSASAEAGTGFTAGPGRVVTVAHLVDAARTVAVRAPGRTGRLHGKVLRLDPRNDLALLSVPGLRAPELRTGAAGGRVRLLLRRAGRMLTLPARVRREITAHLRGARGRPALELGARIAAGDSGAAVVGPGGEVVGVIFARSRERARTAYAVGAAPLARLVGSAARPASEGL